VVNLLRVRSISASLVHLGLMLLPELYTELSYLDVNLS